jgi:hypothetical protein
MASVFISGKVSSVLVGTVAYPFTNWSIDYDAKTLETSNFTSGSFRTYIMGLYGAGLSLEGPYDLGVAGSGGNETMVIGNTYAVTLGVNSVVSYVVNAIFNKITLSSEIDGLAKIKVSATITGSFTTTIS